MTCTLARWVEIRFARLRRTIEGRHRQVGPPDLHACASESARREDHRRQPNGTLAKNTPGLALAHPVGRVRKGDRQRRRTA